MATLLIISTAMTLLVADRQEVIEALKEAGVSNSDFLRALFLGTAVVISQGLFVIVIVARRRAQGPRSSAGLSTVERLLFGISDRRFRQKSMEMEKDAWRNQIIRETYAQVLEQQERGLLCPNCKGKPGG
ncbi:hypothetical protein [Streptomyces sp. NPDC058678]|uniref:hypothetical protein n=1 Tax=Streptomyces sp. NPDC058678 TaxID=3346595 RepID=UPI00365BAF95